jgi:hypothetical protein
MKLRAHTAEKLLPRNACQPAREWILSLPASTTARQAWQQCQRGDWMLWVIGALAGPSESESRKRLVLCACECARLALKHVPAGEERPRICIETAEAWARGEASVDQVYDAARAAYAAYAAYADYAASVADYAAYAASATAYADYAASVADYAAYAASAQCADIVRKHYPYPPRLRARKP